MLFIGKWKSKKKILCDESGGVGLAYGPQAQSTDFDQLKATGNRA